MVLSAPEVAVACVSTEAGSESFGKSWTAGITALAAERLDEDGTAHIHPKLWEYAMRRSYFFPASRYISREMSAEAWSCGKSIRSCPFTQTRAPSSVLA